VVVPASGHIDTTLRVVLGRKRLFRGNIHAQRGLSFGGGFARLSTHATQCSSRSRDPRDGCTCTNRDTRPALGESQKAARSQATSSSIALSSSILEPAMGASLRLSWMTCILTHHPAQIARPRKLRKFRWSVAHRAAGGRRQTRLSTNVTNCGMARYSCTIHRKQAFSGGTNWSSFSYRQLWKPYWPTSDIPFAL